MKLAYKNWRCNKCNLVFDTRQLLSLHKKDKHGKSYIWKCAICGSEFSTRRLLYEHRKEHHPIIQSKSKHAGFHPIINAHCRFCNRTCKTNSALTLHEKFCKLNPNHSIYKGHEISAEVREKISKKLKCAILDGRAHGWANVKDNKCGMSYPELWFEAMLKDNALDLNYEYNKQFYQYKLDFAWESKRLCIEIDGSQHYLMPDRAESDKRKDELLRSKGWKVLRLKWGYIAKCPNDAISKVREFLNGRGDVSIPLYKTKYEVSEENRKTCEMENIAKDSMDRYNRRKITPQQFETRKRLILNSGIDLSKIGWVSAVSKITKLSRRSINLTVNHFSDLKEKVFYRTHKKTCSRCSEPG